MTPRPAALAHADRVLIEAVRAALASVADAERAPKMQAYMKSARPFLGVPSPILKREMSALAKQHPPADAEVWHDTILALFREATYREEWYAALNLAARTRYRSSRRWWSPAPGGTSLTNRPTASATFSNATAPR